MGNECFVGLGWGKANMGVACPKMGTGGPNMVQPLSTKSSTNGLTQQFTENVYKQLLQAAEH